jgi:hypothetical protein
MALGDELRALIGKTAEEIAALIVDLHNDLPTLAKLSVSCQDFIKERYSEAATVNALKAAIDAN